MWYSAPRGKKIKIKGGGHKKIIVLFTTEKFQKTKTIKKPKPKLKTTKHK